MLLKRKEDIKFEILWMKYVLHPWNKTDCMNDSWFKKKEKVEVLLGFDLGTSHIESECSTTALQVPFDM